MMMSNDIGIDLGTASILVYIKGAVRSSTGQRDE